MNLTRARLRCSAWMAALAVLVAALAPGLAQALGTGPSLLEVCTASGPRWLSADPDRPDAPKPGALQALDQCPYCSLHVPVGDLPPPAPVAARRVDTVTLAVPFTPVAPPGAPQRRAAPARAPPAAA